MTPRNEEAQLNPDGEDAHEERAASAGDNSSETVGAAARARAKPESTSGLDESTLSARKFLGRLLQLELDEMGSAIHHWHRLAGSNWFNAERALSHAMRESDRYAEQDVWLEEMAAIFRHRPWFTRARPGATIDASEPSAQYVATTAMLALLVRDHLNSADFELLYEPFAALIPVEELQRE